MATVTNVNRARLIMDMIQDGTVASLANYANVELIDAPTALKYAQAFWNAYPHPQLFEANGTTPRNPTNEELALNYINRMRVYHGEVLRSVRTQAAADSARIAEEIVVASELTTDLKNQE